VSAHLDLPQHSAADALCAPSLSPMDVSKVVDCGEGLETRSSFCQEEGGLRTSCRSTGMARSCDVHALDTRAAST